MIAWGVGSFFGWGVYGLNLALNWAADPDIDPVCGAEVRPAEIAVDPLCRKVLEPFLEASAKLARQFEGRAGQTAVAKGPALIGVNDAFKPNTPPHGVTIVGKPTIGVTFFEIARLRAEAIERAKALPLVVTGSSWNEAVLRAHGVEQVRTVLQGIDPALFHPGPTRGLLPDRFLVFSGGKLERRKAQDLVLAAFRIFAERHPDALLVTAWHSPWPRLAASLDVSGLAAPMRFQANSFADVSGWARDSGVRPEQILDLGLVPNAAIPTLLREMDVGLFPNRAEGGTNLVAMECMACGVPAILSANTGHLDLIEDGACYPLERQGALEGREAGFDGLAGWGESDVDEMVAALEAVYADREEARRRGLKGAEKLAGMSWARTARELKAAILPFF